MIYSDKTSGRLTRQREALHTSVLYSRPAPGPPPDRKNLYTDRVITIMGRAKKCAAHSHIVINERYCSAREVDHRLFRLRGRQDIGCLQDHSFPTVGAKYRFLNSRRDLNPLTLTETVRIFSPAGIPQE